MIAYRSFLSVDLAWKFTKVHVVPKRTQHFQRCFSSCGFNYNSRTHIEGGLRVDMDRKKQKMVAKTWRPVSTQSRSTEGGLGDEKHDFGGQVQEIKCTVSSYESTVQKAVQVSEGIDLEGRATPSADDESLSAAQKHSVTVKAGASLMRFIRGKGGATQRTIEEEMKVKIIIPFSRNEDCLIIEGSSAESVARASDRVQAVIDETVKSRNLDYSHFVSLPLAIHPELVNKLINFQNSVLGITVVNEDENLECDSSGKTSDSEDLGIEKSIFIKPKTFHLTVLMLKLWNKDRIEAAAEVLRSVSPKVIDALESRPVSIRLKGLECMKGSPAKARVVYAPVEVIGGEDRLLRACQVITNAFIEAGLVLENDLNQKLKLHATIMNARHRKSKKGSKKVDSFDARKIFGQYGSEDWGEYLIPEAHLSQRFVFDDDGYYHCCASIPFPEEMQLD
ncbi:activating signal cointegrator 1 complex subunit 1 isoform X3 [Solanum tuberosum]|uniref:activating signal cointegrator 1 complex subunit 1 isoform X3 n=1 Tax=Solanum tuberosum TaxID=4113 RepID=UPI0003D28A2B|nr:PREDICTED: activating signal cointegrator 1 complex subunit 1 isoform X3 [Solanum tuberosum]